MHFSVKPEFYNITKYEYETLEKRKFDKITN